MRCFNHGPINCVTCSPLHVCASPDCDVTEGEVIGCRRCPMAYHEECLPLALSVTRTWEFGKRVWISGVDEDGNPRLDENGGRSLILHDHACELIIA